MFLACALVFVLGFRTGHGYAQVSLGGSRGSGLAPDSGFLAPARAHSSESVTDLAVLESGSQSFVGARRVAEVEGDAEIQDCEEKHHKAMLPMVYSVPITVVLVMLSGLFSGLTLGLMGLDVIGLQIVMKGDHKELARCAEQIAPVRMTGNQLLCTLLLGNTAVNSALSILMADIASGFSGFIISTGLIVLFGEILPQAACSRYALQVGAFTVPLVRILLATFYIVTKPMSVVLDWMLGREVGTVFSRTELMEMLKLQIQFGAVDEVEGAIAKQVAEGALSFRDKRASEVMTPLEDAYMLSTETRLGYDTIREIFETGFSRIPVYGRDKNDYRGLLYTKDLMLVDPEDEMKLGDFIPIFHRKVESFFQTTKLVEVLNAFKKGGTHMGLVRDVNTEVDTDPRFEVCGVLTLEDVVEEILQEEIVDETDVYVDVDNHVKVPDGRERCTFNLGVFNPIWRNRGEMLSREEVGAIATHLLRVAFFEGSGLELGFAAVEWLVRSAPVRNQSRVALAGVEVPDPLDMLYKAGEVSDFCTLVLQGRVAVRAGRESFRAEAGSFAVLAADALRPGSRYVPDFSAFMLTSTTRYLTISRAKFMEARELNRDPAALSHSLSTIAAEIAGETMRKDRSPSAGGCSPGGDRLCNMLPPADGSGCLTESTETVAA